MGEVRLPQYQHDLARWAVRLRGVYEYDFYQSGMQRTEKASEAEEQIWFEHQQQQHGESQHCFAWTLDSRVDTGRLVNALTLVQQQTGAANLNYDYDDARGLVRRPASVSPGVTIQAIRHERQASEALLRLKETPFDLASTTPLHFYLLLVKRSASWEWWSTISCSFRWDCRK